MIVHRLITGVVLLILICFPTIAAVSAQETNVGMLRVASFLCPREVAPNAAFPISLDVEYAIQGLPNNASIRGAIYRGNANSTSLLWQSEPAFVSYGGDKVWNLTLTAPPSEGFLNLTAYAFFLDNGTWTFFNNTVNGPGFSQTVVKIGTTASLGVFIGAPNVGVSVDNVTVKTSPKGGANFSVAVGSSPLVGVPRIVEFQNSTRIVFTAWSDGVAQPQRRVLISGDTDLIANYKVQYLLTVSSNSTSGGWYDKGSNVTLSAPTTAPMIWPLGLLGVKENFVGWSGDIQSPLTQLNITMDSPKTANADFSVDYRPLAILLILGIGFAVAAITLVLLRRRMRATVVSEPPETPVQAASMSCPTCGQLTEEGWAHCIKCGAKLTDSASAQS